MNVKAGYLARTAAVAFGQNGSGVIPRCAERSPAAAASPCRNARRRTCRRSRLVRRSAPAAIRDWRSSAARYPANPGNSGRGHRPESRSPVGLDPQVILRRAGQLRFAALDEIVGMGLHPGMVGRGMVRHEIEQQLDAAPCQPFAELRQCRLAAERRADGISGDRKARAADVVLGQVGQNGLELGAPLRMLRETARPAAPICQTLSSQIQSKPCSAKPSIVASSMSARVIRLPASRDRRSSQTRVLI